MWTLSTAEGRWGKPAGHTNSESWKMPERVVAILKTAYK